MSARKSELKEFYDACDADDFVYIRGLIQEEITRLRLLELEHFDEIEDTADANSILSKFALNK